MPEKDNWRLVYEQGIPLVLAVAVMVALTILVFFVIRGLNFLPGASQVALRLRFADILVGAVIYLKTSVDFAIFMGRLMASNPGWKKRIALEIGTALGNGLGTILVLSLWFAFKDLRILLGLMIFLAALVLFELAYSGLPHFSAWENIGGVKKVLYNLVSGFLDLARKAAGPLLDKLIPDLSGKLRADRALPWGKLLGFSFTVPFILGLDDFAGYVPLFSIVNVFGFSVGVIAAHTILNLALFVSPQKTVAAVENEWVSFLGAVAFIGLAAWGIAEAVKLIF